MSAIFSPLSIRGTRFRNRLWVAPMCQYSVEQQDGVPTDWHLVHLGSLARGGAGLVVTEATAVQPEGRISPWDLGLWSDEQQEAFARLAAFVHGQGAALGVQLAHAGRKGSTYSEWRGRGSVPVAEGGWPTLAPSAVAFDGYAEPRAMTADDIAATVRAFGDSAARAVSAGVDVLEIHAAHGYLLHQFLASDSNRRDDGYGGDLAGRARILREVVRAVRTAVPETVPVFVRLSATDWADDRGGVTLDETRQVARWVVEDGADHLDVSSGGSFARADIPVGPGYQVPLAAAVTEAVAGTGVTVNAVGLITTAEQAEQVLADGHADAVMMARALLRDPHLPLTAALQLGEGDGLWPVQYQRAARLPA